MFTHRILTLLSAALFLLASSLILPFAAGARQDLSYAIPLRSFEKVGFLSKGPSYYRLVNEGGSSYIRAHYEPPRSTVTIGFEVDEKLRDATELSWRWRVLDFPEGADESVDGRSDSGGAVYCVFKDGLRSYSLKYVYSSTLPVGTVIEDSAGLLHKMFVIVVSERGENARGKWKNVRINFARDAKRLFGFRDVPRLRAIAILTDGDGTKSEVIADYADLTLSGGESSSSKPVQ